MFNFKVIVVGLMLSLPLLTGCVPDNFSFSKDLGGAGSDKGQFLGATDIDLTEEGYLVVSDAGNSRFQVIDPESGKTVVSGGNETVGHRKSFKLGSMSGIGVDKRTGDVWVCDKKDNKIVRFSREGTPNLKITKNIKRPMDVAVDPEGNAYVLMSRDSKIYKFGYNGSFLGTIAGAGDASMIYPTSITISQGFIYVTDYGGRRILKLNMDGQLSSSITQKGDNEKLIGPSYIHADSEGNLYVLDLGEIPIVILSPNGQLISKVGEFGEERGKFLYPTGIVAKSSEDIYILDNTKNIILNFKKNKS